MTAPRRFSSTSAWTPTASASNASDPPDSAYERAEQVLTGLAEVGVDYNDLGELLERDGIRRLIDASALPSQHLADSRTAPPLNHRCPAEGPHGTTMDERLPG
ncbi:hypothetical protein GCM10023191_024090 [Actinoallomurus oryzae]|uniref:Uncharacterized protein n=1 Tax=Actinoallomurus oryzae TaxID=502180 RepID=A0ABP8PTF6_9ACTN